MLKNYLTIAFRNLFKGKVFTVINLIGLSTGTAIFILLFMYVKEEWTFDAFHGNADRIYRVWVKEHYQGELFFNTVTPVVLGKELQANFPEIQQVARYFTNNTQAKKGSFSEQEKVHFVDPAFLRIFDFPLLRGKAEEALAGIHSAVITEEIGRKYFGEPFPMGQTLTLMVSGQWTDFTVTGVIEKAPSNSSIQYDVILPFEKAKTFLSEGAQNSWTNVLVETYVLLDGHNTATELTAKIAPFVDEKVAEIYKPGEYQAGLQPLTDIHLNKDFPAGIATVSDGRYPYIMAGIAILILALACINFTTLAVGRSVTRAKEVGVRKTTGATRGQLMAQFFSESVLTAAVAMVFGLLLAESALPFFNTLADKQLAIGYSLATLGGLAGLALLTGLIAGAYPAMVLSGFAPIQSLRGMILKMGTDKHFVLRGLVGFQFVLSISLICCTLVMQRQMRFLQNKNLGFDKTQVVVFPYSESGKRLSEQWKEGKKALDLLRTELNGKSGIVETAISAHTFGAAGWVRAGYTDAATQKFKGFNVNGVDEHFIPMMDILLLDGRNFSKGNPSDKHSVIINEAYARHFGLENPVGQTLQPPFSDFKIIGLATNFHFESLHSEVQPLVLATDHIGILQLASDITYDDTPYPKISVKITGENIPAALSTLRMAWQKVASEQSFSYTFVDENLDRQYRAESRLSQIIGLATALAIFIACLGLFGIAILTIAQRTKEIGVRKVLGASTGNIVLQLNRSFTLLVVGAALAAVPISWYFMSGWLADFAYRISISPLTFLLAGVVALGLAWLAVGWQSMRAAMANPVKSLRSE